MIIGMFPESMKANVQMNPKRTRLNPIRKSILFITQEFSKQRRKILTELPEMRNTVSQYHILWIQERAV